jgi:NAD kinase
MMVTPICAHSLTGRSIIVDENTKITIRLRDRDNTVRTDRGVWFDGQYRADVQTGDEISICQSGQETLLVRTTHCGFVQRLREKL